MKLCFDIQHLYYLPQYIPVIESLIASNHQVHLNAYDSFQSYEKDALERVTEQFNVELSYKSSASEAHQFYLTTKFDWVVFGNAFEHAKELNTVSKTILMQHGIGPKQCYYDVSDSGMTVRFVEGEHRLKKLQSLYPDSTFIDTGYAKLDPILSGNGQSFSLQDIGLDPNKKTILYAPTYYPSSIERFVKSFPKEFSNYNIIIKPHQFSLLKAKYGKQRKLLNAFAEYDNVYLAKPEQFNLVPFLAISDIMLSDASSAVFEFLALGKPVIWCDFYKLRWSYRGPLAFRFKKRMDEDIKYFEEMCYHAKGYSDIKACLAATEHESADKVKERLERIVHLTGALDGQASSRIVNYLEEAL